MSLWVQANSSGIHESPTPSPTRSCDSAAIDDSCFATLSGSRIASFTTLVRKRMRSVTATIALIETNGSGNDVSGAQNRPPSAE